MPEHAAFLKPIRTNITTIRGWARWSAIRSMNGIAAILAKAGSTDTDKLIAAAEGVYFDTPFGQVTFRAIDHQSTLGAFVGKTALKDGKGVMIDCRLPLRRRLHAARRRGEEAAAAELTRKARRRPAPPRRRSGPACSFFVIQLLSGLASAVVAVSGRLRAFADLRRHAHRQFRAWRVLHARRLCRLDADGPLLGPASASGAARSLAALAVARARRRCSRCCCCAASTARPNCFSCSRPSARR